MSFKTPDGKTFDNKKAWKKHYLSLLEFGSKTGETLRVNAPIVNGQAFKMFDLKDCTAMLLDHSETVNCDRLTNCKVFIGASCGSVFIRNCTDCEFTVACQQLRTRDCKNVHLNLYVNNEPVIEASTGHTFCNFNGAYKGLAEHFKASNLDPEDNVWNRVFDFHKGDSTYPEPHLTILDTMKPFWLIDDADASDNPVAGKTKVDPEDEDITSGGGAIQEFSLKTTQKEAEAALATAAAADNAGAAVPPPPGAASVPAAVAAPLPGAADAAAAVTPHDPLMIQDIAEAAAVAGLGDVSKDAINFVLNYLAANE